jgi:protein arginine kinase activator
MKCEFCSEPATVHITDMSSGKYHVLHLCEECAGKENVGPFKMQLTVEQIVKGIIAAYAGEQTGELAKLTCPYCGTRYMEFRQKGRLGCPADYEVFRKGLLPILQRIQGCSEHKGKCPRRGAAAGSPQAELIRLRQELQRAVEREHFEEAARLRDLIRAKEMPHEPE